jgi:hypothetical protein
MGDGAIDVKERRAVLEVAGVPQDSTAGALLAIWLDRRPDPSLLAAWTLLVQAMSEQLGPEETARVKTRLLERAHAVAAGGRRYVRRWFESFRYRGRDTGQARHIDSLYV